MSEAPVMTISKDVGTRSEYLQVLRTQIPYVVDVNDASATVQLGEISVSEDELIVKARKPYTLTNQREKWTEGEHQRFLEALKLYGRGWRQIEEHIGTKNAVQIRSHAQKFFSKLEREQATGGNLTDSAQAIDIPPPRPKRKPNRPYPRKVADATGQAAMTAATRQNCSASASAMFSSKPSTGCVVAGSYFQTAVSTPLQVYSARKESDQMQPGGIRSSILSNSAGLKIFGQTFAPAIHSSNDSEETMLDSNDACVDEMSAVKDCGTVVKEAFSFSKSINRMQSVEDLDIRSSPRDNSVESNCASDAAQVKVSEVETLSINSMNEALCVTKEHRKSKESLQCLKTNKANGNTARTAGIEHKVECGSRNVAPMQNLLMMHDGHSMFPIDAPSFAATFTNMSRSFEHPVFGRVHNLAYMPGSVTLARSIVPFLVHLTQQDAANYNLAAFTSLPGALEKGAVKNCKNDKVAETVDAATAAAVATLAAACAWWALQEPMALGILNDRGFPFNAPQLAAVHSAATLAFANAFYSLDGGEEAFTREFPASAGTDNATQQLQDPNTNLKEKNISRGENTCNLITNTNLTISDQNIRKAVPTSCTSSDCDGNERVGGSIEKDFSTQGKCIASELGKNHNRRLSSLSECIQSESGCNSEYQQCQSRVAPRNPAAHLQEARDKRSKGLKDCDFSFMDNPDAQRDSLIRIISEGDLPCAKTGAHIKIPDLVTELEEENVKACQESRNRITPSPDSVLNFDEISHTERLSALNILQGSSSPSRKRTYSSAVGFQPYQRPFRRTTIALSSSSNE